VIRRLVEEQEIGRLEQQTTERYAASLAAGQLRDVGISRRTAQCVHGQLELRIDVPRIDRVDPILQAALFFEDLVHFFRRQILAELHVQLVVSLEQRLDRSDPFFDVPFDRLVRIETGLLREKPDGDSVSRKRLAEKLGVFPGHDPEQRALPRAVEPEHANLRAGEKRQPDVAQNH
jgi:hypothetical protein